MVLETEFECRTRPTIFLFDKTNPVHYAYGKECCFMKRDDVLHTLRTHQAEFTREYHVKSLILFGSVARDEAGLESDVDLLVEFSQPVGLFQFIGFQQYLETLLGCRVDLGTLCSLKPQNKDQILRDAIRVT
jgi:predicted nucleotidyltransferase